jgi:hypothetical protein
MSSINDKTSRRAFFLSGGAALGAGVATTAGAAAVLANTAPRSDRQQQLEALAEREAIRQLHMAFSSHMESRSYEAAADLFDNGARLQLSGEQAIGKAAILELLLATGRNQAGAVHSAYRPNARQRSDAVTLSSNRQWATATWHVDVQISTPLLGSSTAAQMARLQGQVADCRWESGVFEAEYVQTAAQWKVASLRYLAA